KRVKALALLLVQFLHGGGDDHVGGAVPVHRSIIPSVVAWSLRLVFMPLLGYRNATDHGVIDIARMHRFDELGNSSTFLKEIHQMQVRITVAIVTRLS